MKLWQKIYLFSLLLLIFTLNIAGFLLIQKFHNDLLGKEVEKCITEQNFVASELKMNTTLLKELAPDTAFNLERSINSLMSEYTDSSNHAATYQILDTQNRIIYTDLDFPTVDSKEELENLPYNTTHYIIRYFNQQHYLYVCRLTTIYNTPVKVYYAKDISSLYAGKNNYYAFFIKLDLLICFIFAIFMYFISRLITRPIDTLITSTQQIASGKYSERIGLQSKDEFSTLSNHFNLMAQTIEDKINALELSNVEKESFINNFTHELKTPLTSIIGYANFIRTSKYNEKLFFDAADYIYKEGKNLEQIAFKMMDLIYAQSQNTFLSTEDIIDLLQTVKRTLAPKLSEKQIELIIQGESTTLMLDQILMKVLLCNLLENAIKASSNNSRIVIKVSTSNQCTTIAIIDSGIGIAPEHLTKIDQPFYIVDKARTRKNNGAGLGLSICKKIAEHHHATLRIESKLGLGTTVTLTFTTTI